MNFPLKRFFLTFKLVFEKSSFFEKLDFLLSYYPFFDWGEAPTVDWTGT